MNFKYQKFPALGHDSRNSLISRPYIPIRLNGPTGSTQPFYALLDSGADKVLLPSELAEVIGVENFASGAHELTVGIGGQRVDVYYHALSVEVLGDAQKLRAEIGFSKSIFIPILGRSFFKHFSIPLWEQTPRLQAILSRSATL